MSKLLNFMAKIGAHTPFAALMQDAVFTTVLMPPASGPHLSGAGLNRMDAAPGFDGQAQNDNPAAARHAA